jgi:hypothetical protein
MKEVVRTQEEKEINKTTSAESLKRGIFKVKVLHKALEEESQFSNSSKERTMGSSLVRWICILIGKFSLM